MVLLIEGQDYLGASHDWKAQISGRSRDAGLAILLLRSAAGVEEKIEAKQ